MTLEYIATGETWSGESINETRHPLNIEFHWSTAALAAIGLRVRAASATPIDLSAAKAEKIAEAWALHERRFAEASVAVNVAGGIRLYSCDAKTRENILAIVGAIVAAPTMVPNPRPYTPKNYAQPVDTTHDEFKAIYLTGLAKGDAFFIAYATHKAAINALTSVEAVAAYDLSTGWPA
ncbi:MAG: hypothetical protein B7Y80_01445 [Hyphomicrobium sp. 32-62-53]|nr:MAG: hypothetical protein B7Z29_01790 [Hyphomicrobium sp. 12-62-95]OYY01419.1 MAG: hypothetical protein B7Y80_01445 [Hyphomicrobium sp. 32-62-53]